MSTVIFILSLFANFHFGLQLKLAEGVFIPNAILLLVALSMVPRKPNCQAVTIAVVLSLAFVALAVLLNVTAETSLSKQFLSGGQLVYSAAIATIVASAHPFVGNDARRAGRLCLAIASMVVAFAAIENRTSLGSVSDNVRQQLYDTGLYEADQRDLAIAGFIRPKALASEPSHAAWTVCAMCLCAVAFMPGVRPIAGAAGLTGLAAIVFYSPGAAAASFVLLCLLLYESRSSSTSAGFTTVVAIGVCGLLVIATILAAVLSERVGIGGAFGVEGSVFIRLIQPFSLASEAIAFNPVAGVGFQGLEEIWTKIQHTDEVMVRENLNTVPGMAILSIPLFTGFYGVIAFTCFFLWLLGRLPYGKRMAFAIVVLFALVQKQSFVVSSAWLIGAVWFLQSKARPLFSGDGMAASRNENP